MDINTWVGMALYPHPSPLLLTLAPTFVPGLDLPLWPLLLPSPSHQPTPPQAMMARRALLLLDGLDEAGAMRGAIERHVTEVLAPQGHVMLVTSRPAGIDEKRFASTFHRLTLCPLTEQQQREVIAQRVEAPRQREALERYLEEKAPCDTAEAGQGGGAGTGQRVTGNPLVSAQRINMPPPPFEVNHLRLASALPLILTTDALNDHLCLLEPRGSGHA